MIGGTTPVSPKSIGTNMEEEKPPETEITEPSLIAIMESYFTRIDSISLCAETYIPHAIEFMKMETEKATEAFKKAQTVGGETNVREAGLAMEAFLSLMARTTRVIAIPHELLIARSFLISCFSEFETFLTDLIRAIYRLKPILFNSLDEKSILIGDLISAASVQEALDQALEKDIDSLLRNSYSDIFKKLAGRLGFESLTAFDRWSSFIECYERRNIIIHCNGVVNGQYLQICEAAGADVKSVKLGDRLIVSPEYLKQSIDLLHEIGLRLGHAIWRKIFPEQIADAEEHVAMHTFMLLKSERWMLAATISEFAMDLAKKRGTKRESAVKTTLINFAIALTAMGKNGNAKSLIDSVDWTSSMPEFRLGAAILCDEFEVAAKIMKQIGRQGEILSSVSYYIWPLFRNFRSSHHFKDAFKTIYGLHFEEAAIEFTEESTTITKTEGTNGDTECHPASQTTK